MRGQAAFAFGRDAVRLQRTCRGIFLISKLHLETERAAVLTSRQQQRCVMSLNQVVMSSTFQHLGRIVLAIGVIVSTLWFVLQPISAASVIPATNITTYPDGRPAAKYRLEAQDYGPVLRHGDGPGQCDYLGARDVWAWEHDGNYFMHYDGAGTNGWLACLATSKDLVHWAKKGPVLQLGSTGADDSASASYGVTFLEGKSWHLFYLGTPHTTPAPDFIPAFPYLTRKARAASPVGPWTKQSDVIPFRTQPGTYYSATASPGHVLAHDGGWLMFFSASTAEPILRTLGIARTKDLNGPWRIDPEPIVPAVEQVENTSLYLEPKSRTWWLFTNHVGLRNGLEYTDAIWRLLDCGSQPMESGEQGSRARCPELRLVTADHRSAVGGEGRQSFGDLLRRQRVGEVASGC